MKRYGLLLTTAGMVLLTGWVLHAAGWFTQARSTKTADPLASPAGWRYRQCQPHHWRYCVLHN